MTNVIITGGTGVTGVALVRYLLDKKINVVALIRKDSLRRNYLPNDCFLEIIECNMEDYSSIDIKLKAKKFDVFFHLAWDGSMGMEKVDNRNNMYLQNQNVTRTLDAVELCHRMNCPIFISTGSQAEYGICEKTITETTQEHPQNGYGCAKLCAGRMTRILCKQYGIRHIWIRLFSIYGPYDGAHSLIQTSISKLSSGMQPEYTSGEQIWDFLYSFDAAKAIYLLAEYGKDGEVYCVANGYQHTLKNYITILHQVVNPSITPIFGTIPYAKNQVMRLQPDISKLVKDTGFFPEYSFEKGIEEIKNWYNK